MKFTISLCVVMFSLYFHLIMTDAPRPWLTVEPANVVKLECRVPFGQFVKGDWDFVRVIEIWSGKELLYPYLEKRNKRGPKLPASAEVEYYANAPISDDDPRVPFLRIVMPLEKDLYGLFLCKIEVSKHVQTRHNYSYFISVNETPGDISNSSFSAEVTVEDKVGLTWVSKPDLIYLYCVHLGLDGAGNVKDLKEDIFRHSTGDDVSAYPGTLMMNESRAAAGSGKNYTMTVYMRRTRCLLNCTYQCQVVVSGMPSSCDGPDVRSPTEKIAANGNSTHVQALLAAETKSKDNYIIVAGLFIALFIALAFLWLVSRWRKGLCKQQGNSGTDYSTGDGFNETAGDEFTDSETNTLLKENKAPTTDREISPEHIEMTTPSTNVTGETAPLNTDGNPESTNGSGGDYRPQALQPTQDSDRKDAQQHASSSSDNSRPALKPKKRKLSGAIR